MHIHCNCDFSCLIGAYIRFEAGLGFVAGAVCCMCKLMAFLTLCVLPVSMPLAVLEQFMPSDG